MAEKSDLERRCDELERLIAAGRADAKYVERELRRLIEDLRVAVTELTANVNRLTTEMNKAKGTWEHGEVKYG